MLGFFTKLVLLIFFTFPSEIDCFSQSNKLPPLLKTNSPVFVFKVLREDHKNLFVRNSETCMNSSLISENFHFNYNKIQLCYKKSIYISLIYYLKKIITFFFDCNNFQIISKPLLLENSIQFDWEYSFFQRNYKDFSFKVKANSVYQLKKDSSLTFRGIVKSHTIHNMKFERDQKQQKYRHPLLYRPIRIQVDS